MLRLLRNKRAQNTMEYALLIAVVIAAFSAMQIYLKRGVQARIRAGADNIPDKVLSQTGDTNVTGLFGNDTQYEPYYVREGAYNMTTNASEGTETGSVTTSGGSKSLTNATSSRTGEQTITGAKED